MQTDLTHHPNARRASAIRDPMLTRGERRDVVRDADRVLLRYASTASTSRSAWFTVASKRRRSRILPNPLTNVSSRKAAASSRSFYHAPPPGSPAPGVWQARRVRPRRETPRSTLRAGRPR
jgi:hypothetical protein